jgi:hypothetical protein
MNKKDPQLSGFFYLDMCDFFRIFVGVILNT